MTDRRRPVLASDETVNVLHTLDQFVEHSFVLDRRHLRRA